MLALFLAALTWPLRYETPPTWDHLRPIKARPPSEPGFAWAATSATLDRILTEGWTAHEGRAVSVSAFVVGYDQAEAFGAGGQADRAAPRALRVTRLSGGALVEGARVTHEGSAAFGKQWRAAQAAQATDRNAPFDPGPARAAAGEVLTCEAPLPPTLADNWINAVNARLVRTRTALVPAEPKDLRIGTTCSYRLRLYGAAAGYAECEVAAGVDLARLEQLVAATDAYCRDPGLGIETVARPLDALRVHPAP